MKEIENMVEEKKKDSSDMSKLVTPQEGKCVGLVTPLRTSSNLCSEQKALLFIIGTTVADKGIKALIFQTNAVSQFRLCNP